MNRLTLLLALGLAGLTGLGYAQPCDERRFESAFIVGGAVCVPQEAERIVVLDPFYNLQMGLELGLPIVGAAAGGRYPETLSEAQRAALTDVGGFDGPDFERITELSPDLILGDAFLHEANRTTLEAIAPTVLIATADWKRYFPTIAEAAGVPERAEGLFTAYQERVEEVRAQVQGVQLSFVRLQPDGFQTYLAGPTAYAPISVLSEAGVLRPAFETSQDDTSYKNFGWEVLGQVEGEVLFYVVGGTDADDLEREVTANPLWQALPAVQSGRAYRVSDQHWLNFGGLASANAVLDDLEAHLTGAADD